MNQHAVARGAEAQQPAGAGELDEIDALAADRRGERGHERRRIQAGIGASDERCSVNYSSVSRLSARSEGADDGRRLRGSAYPLCPDCGRGICDECLDLFVRSTVICDDK